MGGVTLSRAQGMARVMPLDQLRHRGGRAVADRRAGHRRLHQQVVPDPRRLEQGQWWLVFLIVVASLLAVVYVWRFVEVAYFRAPPAGPRGRREAPVSMLVPAVVLVVRDRLTSDSTRR